MSDDNVIKFPGESGDLTNSDLDKMALDADQIAALARLSLVEYDRQRETAAAALGCRVETLDTVVKRQRRNRKPAKAPTFDIAALEQSAASIIASTDVRTMLVQEFGKLVAGEEKNARLLYLIGTSRLLPKTMHAAIKGTSAGGKSEIRKRMLEFFPPESVVSFTSLSEKFLIYYEGDFKHKILSMGEAVATDEQDFQDYLLRELMSEGQVRHSTVQKIGNEIVSMTIEKDGPVSFMVTTTKNLLHPENETRMLSLEINDTAAQTKAVLKKVAKVEGINLSGAAIDYKPWQDFQRWLETGERRVTVPFAEKMAELIPPASVRLRRDIGQVIRAIKAHALLHRAHRDRDQDGQIVANPVDFILVSELMNDILAEGSGLAVSPAVAKTTEAVVEATAKMDNDEGATAQAIGKILKLDKSAARRRLVKAANEGFVINLETRKGQPGRYRATGQAVEGAVLLPQPKVLFASQPTATPQEPAQPCHRDEKANGFQDDDGGKPPLPPVAAGLATGKSLNGIEKDAPVARRHDVSKPAEAVGTDVSLKRCAQCNAGGDELEPQRDGDRLVWLHPECARFWKET